MNNRIEISNRKNKAILVVVVALVAFGTVFLFTGALMNTVYGIAPGDPDFFIYADKKEVTPYNNFLFNGCLTKIWVEGDQTITMDTKGLEELGILYYDVNTCFDMAKELTGYTITSVESYKTPSPGGYFENDHMKITLTKKK